MCVSNMARAGTGKYNQMQADAANHVPGAAPPLDPGAAMVGMTVGTVNPALGRKTLGDYYGNLLVPQQRGMGQSGGTTLLGQ